MLTNIDETTFTNNVHVIFFLNLFKLQIRKLSKNGPAIKINLKKLQ